MISGEPIPVEKEPDAKVTGGTVNGTGAFTFRADRVGGDTMLAQIVRMVSEAQRTRAPIQKLADRVAGWFVPAIILISILTFVIWALFGPDPKLAHALVNAVAVLIIACPCADQGSISISRPATCPYGNPGLTRIAAQTGSAAVFVPHQPYQRSEDWRRCILCGRSGRVVDPLPHGHDRESHDA